MKYRSLAKLTFLLLLLSCNDSKNNKLIIGTWNGAEWLSGGAASNLNAANTRFTFDEKGNYTYEYSTNKETGTYKVENEMLFTKPIGGQEIMVKIARLTKDSLTFEMNRGGIPESLTLFRK